MSSSWFHIRIELANLTPVGIRYPDIIAWKGNTCEIIDTRIWADNVVINETHSCKVAYYTNPPLINGMRMYNSKSWPAGINMTSDLVLFGVHFYFAFYRWTHTYLVYFKHSCHMSHVTCYMFHVTCSMFHVPCYMEHGTWNMEHGTWNMEHLTSNM